MALVKFPDNKKYQHKQLLVKRKINEIVIEEKKFCFKRPFKNTLFKISGTEILIIYVKTVFHLVLPSIASS